MVPLYRRVLCIHNRNTFKPSCKASNETGEGQVCMYQLYIMLLYIPCYPSRTK